jgi:hypothetical protein
MSAQDDPGQLRQRAAETILGTPDLTDELTDAEARPLVHWGVAQAEVAAEQAQAPGALERLAAAAGPGETLADRMSPVRRVMKAINRLAAERHELEPAVVAEEIAYILELAARLPDPPPQDILHTTLAELAGWQAEMDNLAFVWALLTLLGVESETEQQADSAEQWGEREHGENE